MALIAKPGTPAEAAAAAVRTQVARLVAATRMHLANIRLAMGEKAGRPDRTPPRVSALRAMHDHVGKRRLRVRQQEERPTNALDSPEVSRRRGRKILHPDSGHR